MISLLFLKPFFSFQPQLVLTWEVSYLGHGTVIEVLEHTNPVIVRLQNIPEIQKENVEQNISVKRIARL